LADAAPMPDAAPVMIAILPESLLTAVHPLDDDSEALAENVAHFLLESRKWNFCAPRLAQQE